MLMLCVLVEREEDGHLVCKVRGHTQNHLALVQGLSYQLELCEDQMHSLNLMMRYLRNVQLQEGLLQVAHCGKLRSMSATGSLD